MFQRCGIYRGFSKGFSWGKGKYPVRTMVREAVKLIEAGGLNSPFRATLSSAINGWRPPMSLTQFLDEPIVRAELRSRFGKPKLDVTLPLAAPPRTAALGLTGTAFDYLFRFAVLKQHGQIDSPEGWVAAKAVARSARMFPARTTKRVEQMLAEAASIYREYTRKDSTLPGAALIDASIGLAQLDLIIRVGQADFELPPATRKLVVADLKSLLDLTPISQFKATRLCLPNPTFGSAARMVGGADADLILDGTLWDVKVTKTPAFSREMFNQLVGYVCLAQLGGVDGCEPRDHHIEQVGIYFARHGLAHSFALADIPGIAHLPEFLLWFKGAASRWLAARTIAANRLLRSARA